MEVALEANLALQSRLRAALDVVEDRIDWAANEREAALSEAVKGASISTTKKRRKKKKTKKEVSEEEENVALDYVATLHAVCERMRRRKWSEKEQDLLYRSVARHSGEEDEDVVDWSAVSAALGVKKRTASECKVRWTRTNEARNVVKWTPADDKRLAAAVQAFEGHGWKSIAAFVGGDRAPMDCLKRYQRQLNPSLLRSAWTAEEDSLLDRTVTETSRVGEKTKFTLVAESMAGRTETQCRERWEKAVNPLLNKGRWHVVEERRLCLAMRAYDSPDYSKSKWNAMRVHVPTRTDVQLREKWANTMDPQLRREQWTAEDDAKLEAAVTKHGQGKWSLIAAELTGRTDSQVKLRWRKLHKAQSDAHDRKKNLLTNALPRRQYHHYAEDKNNTTTLTSDDVQVHLNSSS